MKPSATSLPDSRASSAASGPTSAAWVAPWLANCRTTASVASSSPTIRRDLLEDLGPRDHLGGEVGRIVDDRVAGQRRDEPLAGARGERRQGDPVGGAGVGQQAAGAAGDRQDGDPAPGCARSGREHLRGLPHGGDVGQPQDPGLAERRGVDPVGARQLAGVRRVRLLPMRRHARLQREDHLAALGGAPADLQQAAAAPEPFDEEHDHLGVVALDEVGEEVEYVQVRLVAGAGEAADPEAVVEEVLDQPGAEAPALADDADRARADVVAPGGAAERDQRAVGNAPDALAVGPDDRRAVAPRDRHELLLPGGAVVDFREPAAADDHERHAALAALLHDAGDRLRGDQQVGDVGRLGQRGDRRMARHPEDLVAARVDRVDAALEALVEQVADRPAVQPLRIGRCAHHGDRRRREQPVEVGRAHRTSMAATSSDTSSSRSSRHSASRLAAIAGAESTAPAQSRYFASSSSRLRGSDVLPLREVDPLLVCAAVAQRDGDDRRVLGIGPDAVVDDRLDALDELAKDRSRDRRVLEVLEPDAAVRERRGDAVLEAELALEPGPGPVMDEDAGRQLAGADAHVRDVGRGQAVLGVQAERGLDRRMGRAAGGELLDRDAERRRDLPRRAEALGLELGGIGGPAPVEDRAEPVAAAEGVAGRGESALGQQGGQDAAARRQARVQGLGHRAEVHPQSAGRRRRDPQRVGRGRGVQPEQPGGRGGRAERPQRRGRVPARHVVGHVHGARRADLQLEAHQVRGQQLGARRTPPLAQREQRGHEVTARMAVHRVVGVVEVERVRGGAVGERGRDDVGPERGADDGGVRPAAQLLDQPADMLRGLGAAAGQRHADAVEHRGLGERERRCGHRVRCHGDHPRGHPPGQRGSGRRGDH